MYFFIIINAKILDEIYVCMCVYHPFSLFLSPITFIFHFFYIFNLNFLLFKNK
jgi:hypothetical protein